MSRQDGKPPVPAARWVQPHVGILAMRQATYHKYLLGLLLAISAANLVDGLVLGIVLQDIKRDLALTDTQLGFLSGLAFAMFYAVMGIPLARWADRGNLRGHRMSQLG